MDGRDLRVEVLAIQPLCKIKKVQEATFANKLLLQSYIGLHVHQYYTTSAKVISANGTYIRDILRDFCVVGRNGESAAIFLHANGLNPCDRDTETQKAFMAS